MDINLQGGSRIPQPLPGASRVATPVAAKQDDEAAAPRTIEQDGAEPTHTEMKRREAVYRAAESFFKDVYAVSDTRFTIFKDASGQYITRYTSLRDGKVTYIPEPDMLAYLERRMQEREALVELRV